MLPLDSTMTSAFSTNPLGRRTFLSDLGLGFTGLVLGSMLNGNNRGLSREGSPPVKVDNVIWLFMMGGVSHLESFDPKPMLNKYAGMTISETPYKDVLESQSLSKNFRFVAGEEPKHGSRILPLQIGYKQHGQSGIEVSDWWPNVANCVDDLAVVRSLWTTEFNHSAQSLTHTGKMLIDGGDPSIGSWAHYGLGSLNDTLPKFITLGRSPSDFGGGHTSHQGNYLGPEHDGVPLDVDPASAIPFPPKATALYKNSQNNEFAFIKRLNQLAAVEYPHDKALNGRIKSYELAFEMQTSVPGIVALNDETEETQHLYGLNDPVTQQFGRQCLVARRLVEKGVRFVQLYHGGSPDNDNGTWDSHNNLKVKHAAQCGEVDKPIGGLLQDLKRRGLLERTLVVFMSEFGRAPNVDLRTPNRKARKDEERNGRDHHIYGFSGWLAGGGIKRGVVCGKTDELGFHAVEDRHYVTDIHATILHQLGLDPRKLEIPGRRRLELEIGTPIRSILA